MMQTDNSGLYTAFLSKDARFDGRFFVGISTTGIYCRPVCKAKQPKAENCTFYPTAAEAEQAGYRPCLLCRPELAPGSSITDATAVLARRAARILEESCGSGQNLAELSMRLGCTDRHLRRVFSAEYNVSPIQYLQTCRLLLAKNLLTDTNLSVLDIALAAGFGSLRRFNDLFKSHYHLSPTALRKRMSGEKKQNNSITLALGYRPPYLFDEMLDFLAARAIPGVEFLTDGKYLRTVHLQDANGKNVYGWLCVGHLPKKNVLTVKVSETLLSVLPQVLARIRHLFDLYCNPTIIYETLRTMNDICPNLCALGTRLPGSFNSFEMSVIAVLGQQNTLSSASILAKRLVTSYGTPIRAEIPELTHVFPSPADILSLEGRIENHFAPLGITPIQAKAIYALAGVFEEKLIDFDLPSEPMKEIEKLMDITGISQWTAQYIAMRTMEWTDAFLEPDFGITKALEPNKSMELLEMSKSWHPWRSYATINLWNYI